MTLIYFVRQVQAIFFQNSERVAFNAFGQLVHILIRNDLLVFVASHHAISCPERIKAVVPEDVRIEKPELAVHILWAFGHWCACHDPAILGLLGKLVDCFGALGSWTLDPRAFVHHQKNLVAQEDLVHQCHSCLAYKSLNIE